ncbi:class A beta-lactamase [Nonomuraea roseoviolacea]|uniref:Beta-lactamase class A n=1 Tax=Nonomuraea roseoviolacea subsp. carminata TaxID=160689 RepID=A0ABT1K936_9ACTN|nr:class A beta-lactamase [Nonomuraea roseoviolacea]MCP2350486.1 beta-lactamase class A [Nonomuraea roseoviolacea subsp. carminata]
MRHVHPLRKVLTRLGAPLLAISTVFAGAVVSAGPPAVAAVAAQPPGVTAGDVARRLRELETAYHGRIGAFAIDTGTGKTLAYRAHERFPSRSTFKAIVCGAILDKARRTDPGLLERTLRWTKDDVVVDSPITGLQENIDNGMTVERLCHAAITVSDNTAGNLLLKQIGGPAGLTRYYRSLGDPIGRLDRWEPELNDWKPGERRDTIMPALMARNLQKITLGGALKAEDRDRLNGWLRASVTGTKRIRAGLPADWTVGDKTGGGAGAYAPGSDIAVAWPPTGAPIVIAVYTNRTDPDATMDNGVVSATASVLARGLGRMP